MYNERKQSAEFVIFGDSKTRIYDRQSRLISVHLYKPSQIEFLSFFFLSISKIIQDQSIHKISYIAFFENNSSYVNVKVV